MPGVVRQTNCHLRTDIHLKLFSHPYIYLSSSFRTSAVTSRTEVFWLPMQRRAAEILLLFFHLRYKSCLLFHQSRLLRSFFEKRFWMARPSHRSSSNLPTLQRSMRFSIYFKWWQAFDVGAGFWRRSGNMSADNFLLLFYWLFFRSVHLVVAQFPLQYLWPPEFLLKNVLIYYY